MSCTLFCCDNHFPGTVTDKTKLNKIMKNQYTVAGGSVGDPSYSCPFGCLTQKTEMQNGMIYYLPCLLCSRYNSIDVSNVLQSQTCNICCCCLSCEHMVFPEYDSDACETCCFTIGCMTTIGLKLKSFALRALFGAIACGTTPKNTCCFCEGMCCNSGCEFRI